MSTDSTQQTLTELAHQLEPVLKAHGVIRASVFGALAREEAGQDRDVDVFVLFEDGRRLHDLAVVLLKLVEEFPDACPSVERWQVPRVLQRGNTVGIEGVSDNGDCLMRSRPCRTGSFLLRLKEGRAT